MSRDYKNVSKKGRRTDNTRHGDLLSFIAGLGIGLVAALAMYLYQFLPSIAPSGGKQADSKTQVATKGDNTQQAAKSTVPEPTFDFYKILPNKEVNISEWEQQDQDNSSPPTIEKGGVYLLQVGSFKTYDAADQVKARLALLGIPADIQRVVINGEDIRQRVRVGPYEDSQKLEEVRKRLIANNIKFVMLRLKVDELSSDKD